MSRSAGRGVRPDRAAGPFRYPAVAALAALLALLILPAAVAGHAALVSADPADGARLERTPGAITLVFDQPVGLGPAGIVVLDGAGRQVDALPETADGGTIVQPLPPLADGWYLVTWAIVSEDGHPVHSAAVFAVGDADAAARPAAPLDLANLGGALLRGVADLGSLVAAGGWAAWWLLGARRRGTRRLAAAGTVLALAGLVGLLAAGIVTGGSAWLATGAPAAIGARVVLLLIALAPVVRPVPAIEALAALAAVASLIPVAGTGHAAGLAAESALLALHLILAATWLGAAPAVLLALRDATLPDEAALVVVRRFSRLATATLGLVLLAGALLAWRLSDGFAGGLTGWAAVLGVKVALVAIAIAGGALARRHLGRSPDRTRLRQLFGLDAALLVAVALASGALSLGGPHGDHVAHRTGSARCAATVGDGSVALIVTPGLPGTNRLRLDGVDAAAKAVIVRLVPAAAGDAAITVLPDPDPAGGAWVADATIPLAGRWRAELAIRIDTSSQATGACDLAIGP